MIWMRNEFSQLEVREHQKEFLADWWSKGKLFRGGRQTGKTTLMLCEARRFSEKQFSILYLTSRLEMAKSAKNYYKDIFGEQPTFDIGSYHQVKSGGMAGFRPEVVICDEFQDIDLQTFEQKVMPMDPVFIRASACKSSMGKVHYLKDQEDGDFFDSVYDC